jgi:protein-tyrosine phosphatase
MKYGIYFTIVAALLFTLSFTLRGWYWIAIWPGASFFVVALGYLGCGPQVFGKGRHGRLRLANVILLLPYLLITWSTWQAARLLTREPPFNRINDQILIGRRLLSNEVPASVNHVIDLTAEFNEPVFSRHVDYHSFPILDGIPAGLDEFNEWLTQAAALSGAIYVHCALGHGRTGLFATALLVKRGHNTSMREALQVIQATRPGVELSKDQWAFLELVEAHFESHREQVADPGDNPLVI